MIELKFYRDYEYVYINNPDGTTKRVTIEDFENTFNVDTAELPTYTSSDAGKVLVVNSDGTGLEWAEGGGGASDNQYLLTLDGEGDIDNSVSDVSSALYSGKTIVAPFTALYTVFDTNTNNLLFILLDGVDNLGSSVASMAYRVTVYVPKQDNSGFTYSTEYSYTTNMSIV